MIKMIKEWFKMLSSIDYLFITLLLCWIIGLVVALALKVKFPKPQKSDKYNNSLQYIAERARRSWLTTCWVWQSVYYLMIIGSLVCTVIVLYISCYMQGQDGSMARIFLYSAFSIIFNMVPYMIDLKKISSAYHAAHRLVNESLLRGNGIEDALIKGEELIRASFD